MESELSWPSLEPDGAEEAGLEAPPYLKNLLQGFLPGSGGLLSVALAVVRYSAGEVGIGRCGPGTVFN